jgi:hypothetical protein
VRLKGIKRGKTIELIDRTINISDGTEITFTLETLQVNADDTPLTDLLGLAPGSFASPEEADQFIRQERDKWDY